MKFFTLSFATPELVILAFVAPVFVFALHVYDYARRQTLTRKLGDLPVIGKVLASASPGRRIVKDLIAAAGLSLVLFSAARPQIEGKRRVELRGLDVVVAVDVSKSMLVDDVGGTVEMKAKGTEVSRLARARELASALIEELPGDRVGPVVFAGAAAHFPLTEDHQVASRFLSDLGPNDLPPGSNLAEVFRVSRCMLRPDLYEDLGCARIGRRGHGGDPLRGESLDPGTDKAVPEDDQLEQQVERGKAIVILTDGGEADAATVREVATARELGIAVFIVGVGTTAGGVVHEIDPFSGKRTSQAKVLPDGTTVTSKRDDAGMKAIAAAGGDEARYLQAAEKGEVDPMPIVEALRAVNRGLATKRVKEMRDIYQPFLFAALMLLVTEVAISTRRRRRYPEAG
ncbi:MAG: von Willebrand factor type [Deltaproteobacteria bacterium]|nr:von Willebrand factor type [Deltaproteobacteria bacterium]